MESTLVEIIKLYQKFEAETHSSRSNNNLLNFIAFLNNRVDYSDSDKSNDKNHYKGWNDLNRQVLMEMVTAYLGKMGRYADNYSRKAMPTTQLSSIEEFTYTIPLLQETSLSKSELIYKNGHAISTGTEIIKRLIKKKILVQFPDDKDKRSMRIKLSEYGKGALFSSMTVTKGIAQVATGILSTPELIQMLSSLKKLNQFHDDIHRHSKHLSLDELLALPELNKV